MKEILELLSLDYVAFFAALLTVVIGFIALKELVEKFCRTFGIKLRYIEEKREMQKCQTDVKASLARLQERQDAFERQHKENMASREKYNKKVMACINALKEDIDEMRAETERREAQKRFKKLRYDLLNYADKIINAEQVTAEMITEIFDEIDEYHTISKKYEFENGRVDVSISVIKAKYEELLKSGKVTR